jgi:cobalt/nickel transport system ATP-binding protein
MVTAGAVLESRGLSFAYAPGHWAVRNVDLSVPAGGHIALLGANGAGKSTLLLLLSGAMHLCHGQVFVAGQQVSHSRQGLSFWRRNVGLLLQDPEDQLLAPTVEQDVAFGPLQAGCTEAEARAAVAQALAALEITDLATRPLHALSLGEKKRVALAGLIVQRPAVLLLDEPTSGLDPAGVRALGATLQTLAASGTAIVQATHDVDFAYEYASEVCVVFEGGILSHGEPDVVLADSDMLKHASLQPPVLLEAALAMGGVAPFPRSRAAFRQWVQSPLRRSL